MHRSVEVQKVSSLFSNFTCLPMKVEVIKGAEQAINEPGVMEYWNATRLLPDKPTDICLSYRV